MVMQPDENMKSKVRNSGKRRTSRLFYFLKYRMTAKRLEIIDRIHCHYKRDSVIIVDSLNSSKNSILRKKRRVEMDGITINN